MKKPPFLSLLLVAAGAVLLARALWRPSGPPSAALDAPAPAFSLSDTAGRMVSLSDYKGKVVLLDFWASWCESCQEEMPVLNALHRRYRAQGFTVLAPSLDRDGRKAVLPFIARFGLDFPVLISDARTARAYGVFGLPTAYLIDASGRIARKYAGPVDAGALENDILGLFKRRIP